MKDFIRCTNERKQEPTETRRFLHENAEPGNNLPINNVYTQFMEEVIL